MRKPLRHWLRASEKEDYVELQTRFFRISTQAYTAWLDELTGAGAYTALYRRMLSAGPPQAFATIGDAVWSALDFLANDPPLVEGPPERKRMLERLGCDIIDRLLVDAFRDVRRHRE